MRKNGIVSSEEKQLEIYMFIGAVIYFVIIALAFALLKRVKVFDPRSFATFTTIFFILGLARLISGLRIRMQPNSVDGYILGLIVMVIEILGLLILDVRVILSAYALPFINFYFILLSIERLVEIHRSRR